MPLKLRLVSFALSLLVCDGVVKAQTTHAKLGPTFVTDMLDIRLEGYADKCGKLKDVQVVMSNEEDLRFHVTQDPKDPCHWTATRPRFDAGLEHFSLRLGAARTTCKRANGDSVTGAARLTFYIYKAEVRQVSISTVPQIPISYVRGVLAFPDDNPPNLGCAEKAPFNGQPIDIPDVWFSNSTLPRVAGQKRESPYEPKLPVETLRLQLGRAKADPMFPGLVINDEAVMRYLKSDDGSINIDKLVAALAEERVKSKLSTAPLLSSKANSADRANLERLAEEAYKADRAMLERFSKDKLVLRLVLTGER